MRPLASIAALLVFLIACTTGAAANTKGIAHTKGKSALLAGWTPPAGWQVDSAVKHSILLGRMTGRHKLNVAVLITNAAERVRILFFQSADELRDTNEGTVLFDGDPLASNEGLLLVQDEHSGFWLQDGYRNLCGSDSITCNKERIAIFHPKSRYSCCQTVTSVIVSNGCRQQHDSGSCQLATEDIPTHPNRQKFFASFFQKRSACLP